MSTETMQCQCGQRIEQRVDFITPAYVVTFTDPASGQIVVSCPSCARELYQSLRSGDLKSAA